MLVLPVNQSVNYHSNGLRIHADGLSEGAMCPN